MHHRPRLHQSLVVEDRREVNEELFGDTTASALLGIKRLDILWLCKSPVDQPDVDNDVFEVKHMFNIFKGVGC